MCNPNKTIITILAICITSKTSKSPEPQIRFTKGLFVNDFPESLMLKKLRYALYISHLKQILSVTFITAIESFKGNSSRADSYDKLGKLSRTFSIHVNNTEMRSNIRNYYFVFCTIACTIQEQILYCINVPTF